LIRVPRPKNWTLLVFRFYWAFLVFVFWLFLFIRPELRIEKPLVGLHVPNLAIAE
jgi:hypothetical protein